MEFYVKIEPGAGEFRVEKGTYPRILLEQPAENGRANAELLDRLEERLGTRPAIISGHRSSRKKLKADLQPEELDQKLYTGE